MKKPYSIEVIEGWQRRGILTEDQGVTLAGRARMLREKFLATVEEAFRTIGRGTEEWKAFQEWAKTVGSFLALEDLVMKDELDKIAKG
jgi:hypothetical protein